MKERTFNVSRLSNPEFSRAVAKAYVNGQSREDMADIFGVHKQTITDWIRDPRVQAHAIKIAQERVTRIVRKIDASIESRLESVEKIPTMELMKVRREYLERTLKVDVNGGGKGRAETMNETMNALESDPALATALLHALTGAEAEAPSSVEAD